MNVAKAIEDAEYGRFTHAKCIEWIEEHEGCGCPECIEYVKNMEEYGGDAKVHRKWVEKYDNIIDCLSSLVPLVDE